MPRQAIIEVSITCKAFTGGERPEEVSKEGGNLQIMVQIWHL